MEKSNEKFLFLLIERKKTHCLRTLRQPWQSRLAKEIPVRTSSPFSPSPHSACTGPPSASCPRPFFARSPATHRFSLPLQVGQLEWRWRAEFEKELVWTERRPSYCCCPLWAQGRRWPPSSSGGQSELHGASLWNNHTTELSSGAKPMMAAFWFKSHLFSNRIYIVHTHVGRDCSHYKRSVVSIQIGYYSWLILDLS